MKPTVLHIEDERFLASLVQEVFRQLGFKGTMLAAHSVAEGLRVIEQQLSSGAALDLVLVDMRLPDGTGLDVIRRVKTNPAWAALPVLVLSGERDPQTVTEAYALGANCFVSKSPQGKTIIDAVDALYHCWLEGAVLPDGDLAGRRSSVLGRAVGIRQRLAEFYTRLAGAFSSQPEAAQFWLTLALNEGNFANLLAFAERQFDQRLVPPELLARLGEVQGEREACLGEAEAWLRDTPRPAADAAYGWVLRFESTFDGDVQAAAVGCLFPQAPVATQALRQRFAAHLELLTGRIAAQAEVPELRQAARDLQVRIAKMDAMVAELGQGSGLGPRGGCSGTSEGPPETP